MIAFVLGGGGNRGPLQVGALQVLLEHDIHPDMLVGASAGAINAAILAPNPNLAAALELSDMWQRVDKDQVFHGNRLTMLWRFLTGKDSLYSNAHFQLLIKENLPPSVESFGDLEGIRLYVVATQLDTGACRVFGDDPHERLVDAIMASTALPPFFPPWHCGEELLIDGGIAADLPVRVAVARGAKEVYALHLVDAPRRRKQVQGLLNIAEQAINNLLSRQLSTELAELASLRAIRLHHVPLSGFYGLPLWDLSHTEEMIQDGRRQMEEYLQRSRIVTKHGKLAWMRETARRGLERAFKRSHTMLVPSHQGPKEELELRSASSSFRS